MCFFQNAFPNAAFNPDLFFCLFGFGFFLFLINLLRDAPEDFRNKTMCFASLISLFF